MAYVVEVTICIGNGTLTIPSSAQVDVSLICHLKGLDNDVLTLLTGEMAEALHGHRMAQNVSSEAQTDRKLDSSDVCESPRTIERNEPRSIAQEVAIQALLSQNSWSEASMREEMESRFGIATFEQLTAQQATNWLLDLQRLGREKAHQGTTTDH